MDFLNRACDVALAGLYMVNAEQGIRAIHDHAAGLCDLLPLREWAKFSPVGARFAAAGIGLSSGAGPMSKLDTAVVSFDGRRRYRDRRLTSDGPLL